MEANEIFAVFIGGILAILGLYNVANNINNISNIFSSIFLVGLGCVFMALVNKEFRKKFSDFISDLIEGFWQFLKRW